MQEHEHEQMQESQEPENFEAQSAPALSPIADQPIANPSRPFRQPRPIAQRFTAALVSGAAKKRYHATAKSLGRHTANPKGPETVHVSLAEPLQLDKLETVKPPRVRHRKQKRVVMVRPRTLLRRFLARYDHEKGQWSEPTRPSWRRRFFARIEAARPAKDKFTRA